MTLEKLLEIGISEEQAKKLLADIKNEIKENYVEKSMYDEALTVEKQLKDNIKQRDEQLDELKKIDVNEFTSRIEELQKENEIQRKNHAVDIEIIKAKGKNIKAVKALIDLEKVKIKEDGSIEGLDLEGLKKSDSYLFDIEKVTREGTGFTVGKRVEQVKDPKNMNYEEYQAYHEQNNQNQII